jgi:hypothetical protein
MKKKGFSKAIKIVLEGFITLNRGDQEMKTVFFCYFQDQDFDYKNPINGNLNLTTNFSLTHFRYFFAKTPK